MMIFRILPPLLAAIILPPCVQAQEGGNKQLAPVVIDASSVNVADSTNTGEGTSVKRVIDREEFGNRITSLADTLSDETGVQIRRTGGLGSPSSISIRGSSTKQVQVYLDGMLLNDPVHGGVDLSLYSLHDIAEMEVYPGSPPARFAEAGVGGVVSMKSLDPQQKPKTRISLGGGSFGSRKAGFFNSGAKEDVNYWVSLNRQSADNDFTYENRAEWFNPNDGEKTTRRNADFEQNDASAKLSYKIGQDRSIDALVQWSDRDRGIPSIQNWRDNEARLETENRRLQMHYQNLSGLDGTLHGSHRVVLSRIEERYRDLRGRIGSGSYDIRTTTDQVGINSTLSWILGPHIVSGTVKAANYDQAERDYLQSIQDIERDRNQVTSALSHEWDSPEGRWHTQAVVRHYRIMDDFEEPQSNNTLQTSDSDSALTGWHLGMRFAPVESLRLFGNIARQIRVPTLMERFGQQGLFVGNADLEAEEALNADASARFLFGAGFVEITGFQRKLEPAIISVYDARGVGRYVNARARVGGIEARAQYDLLDFWTLTLSGTTQDSENLSRNVADRDDKRLPGIYHQSAKVKNVWRFRPFRLSLTGRYDDELYYDSANRLPADARRTVSAALSWEKNWKGGDKSEIRLEAGNLTNELYQDFNRFPAMGRNYSLNLQHTF